MKLNALSCFLMAWLLISCDRYFSSLTIVNDGTSIVENVSIEANGYRYEMTDISPGENAFFSHHVSGEGVPILRFRQRGISKTFEACYYTATLPPEGRITIHDNRVERRCDL